MMKLAVWSLCCLLAVSAGAQTLPEKVNKLTRDERSHEWYVGQARLWKAETDKNPKNAGAWMNYFLASRYAGFQDTASLEDKSKRMAALIESMGRAVPNSFEYHFARWWNGGNTLDLFPDLQKAYELQPNNPDVYESFVTYYEMKREPQKIREFCEKWYAAKDLAPGLLNFHYNVLMSLEKNAILVTEGDNDTYPVWLLQYAKNIRPDVLVLNLGLFSDPQYRQAILKENNLKPIEINSTDDWEKGMASAMKELAENNTIRPLYFALTVDTGFTSLIKDDLYVIGLASRYSPKRLDNIAILKKNWESFRLDYLTCDFYSEDYLFNRNKLAEFNMNYITPALMLYEHYMLSGEMDKATAFKDFALKIGREGQREEEVREYIRTLGPDGQTQTISDAKTVESSVFEQNVSVYPNPTQNKLTIQLPEATASEVQIVTMQGTIVYSMKASDRSIIMETGQLASGAYIVRIKTAIGEVSRQIQITH